MIQFASEMKCGGRLVGLGLEEANLSAMLGGNPALCAGGTLGVPGNDWAFVAAASEAVLAHRMGRVAERAVAEAGQRPPAKMAAARHAAYAMLPVPLREGVLHVVGFLASDLDRLRRSKAVSYRFRVMDREEAEAAEAAGLPSGVPIPRARLAGLRGGDASAVEKAATGPGSVMALVFWCRTAAEAAVELRRAGFLDGPHEVRDVPSNKPAWASAW